MTQIETLNCPACGAQIDPKTLSESIITCPACGSSLALTDWAEDGSLICRECGTPNSSTTRYCLQCKQPLQAACPMCYTLNSLQSARCRKCGVDLQRAWERQNSWMAEKQRHDQERQEAIREAQIESRKADLQRLLMQLDEPDNHPMAIFYLEQYGAEAVQGLIGELKSPDPDARYGAAHALGQMGDTRAIQPLITALQDPEVEVRFWAAAALGRLKAGQAVVDLGHLLHDSSKEVRAAAAEALEHIGTPQAKQVLEKGEKPGWWPF
jgi:hypothetical protein